MSADVVAAGGVLWQRAAPAGGDVLVAVAHRPKYDDWSLPKGKRDPGETTQQTAVREICEESGFSATLGPPLRRVSYQVQLGHKTVDYWAMPARAGDFTPNGEVDELRWLAPPQAGELLSYASDRAVLTDFMHTPVPTAQILLIRHAKAGDRNAWQDSDHLRPLTSRGAQQAARLPTLLRPFGPADSFHSAPPLRCVETIRPLAEEARADVQVEEQFSEEGFASDPRGSVTRLAELAAMGGQHAICSQGGAIPALVSDLLAESHTGNRPVRPINDGRELGATEIASAKASTWVLHFGEPDPATGRACLVSAEYLLGP